MATSAATGSVSGGVLERIVAALMLLVGLLHALPGAYLATLGGSLYYVCAGLALIVAGVLVWRRRAAGYGLYLLVLIATIGWALWESGLDGWALLPRINLLLGGGVLVLIAWWLRKPRAVPMARVVAGAALLAAAGAGLAFVSFNDDAAIAAEGGTASAAPAAAEGDWTALGRTNEAERFSPLTQVTPANVGKLEKLWQTRVGMPAEGMVGALQATPLKIGDTLYTCGMTNQLIALDAETGAIRWKYDPQMDRKGIAMSVCRGITHVPAPVPAAGAAADACGDRIVILTHDARMIAVRMADGVPCPTFGTNGQVDLTEGMGPVQRGYLYYTSPAILSRGRLIFGSSVLDGQMASEPSGVIRAYDAISGQFAWAWDMGRPGQTGMPGPGEMFTRGTPNAWAPLTADEETGAVFVPLGNPTPDYVAEHRTPEMLKYGSAIVSLDGATGALRWSFQTTHRDVWDYDNASPPTVTKFPTPQGLRPAVIVPTKRGVFFVLDRDTGRPLVRTVERPVPQGPVPGEVLSPTQPYPEGMPIFSDRLTEARMWGISPLDQLWCRIKFKESRYEGDFTPISLKPTIVYPGYYGGAEWGGVSVDTDRRIMVLNVMHFPLRNQLVPRAEADPKVFRPFEAGKHPIDIKNWPQAGTAYAAKTGAFLSPIGVPCTQPPFSEIAAVDLKTRSVLWRKPLGSARGSGPFGLKSGLNIPLGTPAVGGSMVTKSGLTFIAAAQDSIFRAFETKSGKVLWETRLPAAGHANPMTYWSAKSGRQIVLIPASGHPQLEDGSGDYIVAYALPASAR